jgi:hypothetical protein
MEDEDSLNRSQEIANGRYPEPDKSSRSLAYSCVDVPYHFAMVTEENPYSIYCGDVDRPSSVTGVDHYIIITILLDYIFSVFPLFMHQWEFRQAGIFLRKVAYTSIT